MKEMHGKEKRHERREEMMERHKDGDSREGEVKRKQDSMRKEKGGMSGCLDDHTRPFKAHKYTY